MAKAVKRTESKYLASLEEAVRHCEAIRRDTKHPMDITLGQYVKQRWGVSMDSFYSDLGLNGSLDTIQNIVNLPDPALRWLIPEIFRDALRLGLRKNPIYPSLIAGEQSVQQVNLTMPAINMSDAAPRKVGVGETIPVGDVSFGSKQVKIYKVGRGIKIPYEVIQYVALNVVSTFLQDFGVKMAMGIDTLAMNTILNGDQADGSDSVAVIGVTTASALAIKDILKPWVRLGRLGKTPNAMVGGEDISIDIIELLASTRVLGDNRLNIQVKSPIPQQANHFVHGSVPANQIILIDPTSALIKLNAQPLLVESEKIVSNQTEATYATITTGFASIYRDARLVVDKSIAFSGNGFPTWMDPSTQETVTFD